jgi:fibronectin-binding autotransporter adhesin
MQNMPSLQQRTGNRHWAPAAAPAAPVYVFCKDPAQNFRCLVTDEQALTYANGAGSTVTIESGAWVRVEGSRSELEPVSSTTGLEIEQNVGAIELGIDRLLSQNDVGDRLVGGVSLRYAQSSTDVTSVFGNGDIDTDGYGLGASLTWYQMGGLYVDAQARAMWTQSDLSSSVIGSLAEDVDGFGYGLSVEVGKEIALNNGWNITPQAQLSYVNVQTDDFAGPFARITDVEGESLALRLGLVFSNEESWQAEDGTTSRRAVSMGAHVIKEFRPESSVNVSGTTLTTEREDLNGEISLGGSYNWSDDKYSVYSQVAASTGLDNFGDSTRVGATAGFRMQWE